MQIRLKKLVLPCLYLGTLALPATSLRGDIVDDISELEKQPKKIEVSPSPSPKPKATPPSETNFSDGNAVEKQPKPVDSKTKKDP